MACCWNRNTHQCSQSEVKGVERQSSQSEVKGVERQCSQSEVKGVERQSSQDEEKWDYRLLGETQTQNVLIDCINDGKEDMALCLIASMDVKSLHFGRIGYNEPYHCALEMTMPRIVNALLKKGVIWEVHWYTHEIKDLFECIENNKQDEALDLIGALDVTSNTHRRNYYNGVYATTLMNAVQHGMIRVVRALFEKLVDPYERESIEIEVLGSCLNRNMQDEALALVASMDVTAFNHIPYYGNGVYVKTLMNAVQYRRIEVVRALLEKRVERDEPLSLEIKAVFECIESNKPDEALDLIGALDVTALHLLAYYGQGVYVTTIMYALQHGQIRIVRALLVKGAEWDKYHTLETKALLECLERTMHTEALDLITLMDVANLNIIADFKEDPWGGKNVSPLMYAVLHGEMRIVKALLEKGVDVNIGRVCCSSTYSVSDFCEETPLCYAIREENIALMDMLLEHGADPLFDQAKTRNIRGKKDIRVLPLISFVLAFRKGGSIFGRIIRYSNMYTEFADSELFGSKVVKHTCLCYAVQWGFVRVKHRIHQIIQRGGVVCSGNPDYTAMEVGYPGAKGICGNIFNALKRTLSIRINDGRNVDFHTCLSDARQLLTLLCATDYVHESSCLYKTIMTYIDTAKANIIPVDLDGLDDLNLKRLEQALEERRQILTWMTDITKQPSTLKHICRVYIRRSIPRLCTEAVETLPLPSELIEYVSVVNRCEFEQPCPL